MTKTNTDKVTIAVRPGLHGMENGVRSINSLLEELLPKAETEVQVVAYRITKGSGEFREKWIATCLNRGLRVSLVINRLDKQSSLIKNKLLDLVRDYSYFTLLRFLS